MKLSGSTASGNSRHNLRKGISLAKDLRANEIRDKVVEAAEVAYVLEDSLGENKAADNRIIGKPKPRGER